MARTETTASRERVTVMRRYPWPENLLNWWTIVMLATGGLLTGVFGDFMSIQNRMGLGTPWLFPYAVTVGSLTIFWIIIMIILMAQKKLQPAWVMLASFILIALFLAGLIETAIQLFGNGNVSAYCNRYVNNNNIRGVSIDTLAWLEQNSICSQWDAAFAFWIIGLVFLVWMMIMASQISQRNSKYSSTTKRWYYFIDKPSSRSHHCTCNNHNAHHALPLYRGPGQFTLHSTPDTRQRPSQGTQHYQSTQHHPSTSTSEELRGRRGRTSGRATRGNSGEDVGGAGHGGAGGLDDGVGHGHGGLDDGVGGPGYQINRTFCGGEGCEGGAGCGEEGAGGKEKKREASKKRKRESGNREGWWWRA